MNKQSYKTLWTSLGTLVILGGILGLVVIKPWDKLNKPEKFFGDQIELFCVNNSCLQKNNGSWRVTTGNMAAPSNNETDNDLANKLASITLGDVISTNPDNFVSLGIGESEVIISANGRSLEIGKINSNYDGTYVREKDGRTVYNIDVVLEKDNLGNADQWINKVVTNLAVLQTIKITISKNGRTLTFVPKNGIWDDPKWMEKVDGLTAINFLGSFKPGNEIETTINVATENSQVSIVLGEMVVSKNTSLFWVTTNGKDYYSIGADDYHLLTGKIK